MVTPLTQNTEYKIQKYIKPGCNATNKHIVTKVTVEKYQFSVTYDIIGTMATKFEAAQPKFKLSDLKPSSKDLYGMMYLFMVKVEETVAFASDFKNVPGFGVCWFKYHIYDTYDATILGGSFFIKTSGAKSISTMTEPLFKVVVYHPDDQHTAVTTDVTYAWKCYKKICNEAKDCGCTSDDLGKNLF